MTEGSARPRITDSPSHMAVVVAVLLWLGWSAISFVAALDADDQALGAWGALAIGAPVIQLALGLGLIARRSWARLAFVLLVPLLSVVWPGPLSLATIGIQVPLYLLLSVLLLLRTNRSLFEPVGRQVALAMIATVIIFAAGSGMNSLIWMTTQRTQASRAVADARFCERLVQAIADETDKRQVASNEQTGIQSLGRHIQIASQQASLPGTALQGIYPQSSRRLADSAYMIKPTVLSLRRLSLGQLTVFLYHLTAESGLRVRDLRLRSPRNGSNDEVWDVDATVTYLIYAPPTTGRNP